MFLFQLLITFLMLPVMVLWVLSQIFSDLVDYYAGWIYPAVFGTIAGLDLLTVSPSDPDLPYESIMQVIAGSHILGISTPYLLLLVGIFSWLFKPVSNKLKSRKD